MPASSTFVPFFFNINKSCKQKYWYSNNGTNNMRKTKEKVVGLPQLANFHPKFGKNAFLLHFHV